MSALLAAPVVCALLAAVLAARRREHRPLAWALSASAAAGIARELVPGPFELAAALAMVPPLAASLGFLRVWTAPRLPSSNPSTDAAFACAAVLGAFAAAVVWDGWGAACVSAYVSASAVGFSGWLLAPKEERSAGPTRATALVLLFGCAAGTLVLLVPEVVWASLVVHAAACAVQGVAIGREPRILRG